MSKETLIHDLDNNENQKNLPTNTNEEKINVEKENNGKNLDDID